MSCPSRGEFARGRALNRFDATTPADIARVIDEMDRAGGIGIAHLFHAMLSGRIAVLPLMPNGPAAKFKAWVRLTKHRPAVALIGDDDGLDRGPDGWPQARRAVGWARAVMLHAAGAELYHYEVAIVAAELTQRMLIVECCSATLPAWVDIVQNAAHRPKCLIIQPPDGTHPIPDNRGTMH